MPIPPPRPALAAPATATTTRLFLGVALLALPLAAAAQAPASASNAKILTPSVSDEAPNYGGKAVVSATTGPVSPASRPMRTNAMPAASGPTSMSSPGTSPNTTTVTMPTGAYGTYGAGAGAGTGAGIEVMPRGAVAVPAAGRPGAVVVPDASTGPAYAPTPLPVPSYGTASTPGAPYTRDVVTGGDVLVLPDGGSVTTVDTVRLPANVPRKGASMAQVRAGYGTPQSVYKTGGGSRAQPPITRWTYPGFNVVFEYTHVVDVVVPSAPPPLVRTGGLTRLPVNPADPKYKGVPGRALRP